MALLKEVNITIAGLGIILYSPSFASHIEEDSDFFSSEYLNDYQVQKYIQAGTLVGFGTGSPGKFSIRFYSGPPLEALIEAASLRLRLGLHVIDERIHIRDLYDLMEWTQDCPLDQQVPIPNGNYTLTLCSNIPPSGILGDNQVIEVFMEETEVLPRLEDYGVPTLM